MVATQKAKAMPMGVVDYEIKGEEMQFVEIEFDPGEAVVGDGVSGAIVAGDGE